MFGASAFALSVALSSSPTATQAELVWLPVEYPQPVAPHLASAIEAGVREGILRSGVGERSADVLGACDEPTCYARVAEATQAKEMLRTRIVQRNERDYTLTLSLIDPRGRVLASRTADCELCGVTEVSESAQSLAAALAARFAELPRGPGILVIESSPRGAEISIDGEPAGQTPARLEVIPGHHIIEIRAAGYGAVRREVATASGVEQELLLRLQAIEEPGQPIPSHIGKRFEIAGWTLMAMSPVALGIGGWMIAIDGQPYHPSCTPSMPVTSSGRCPRRYTTAEGGISLVVAGGVALVTGIAFVAWQRRARSKKAQARRWEPRAGGFALRF